MSETRQREPIYWTANDKRLLFLRMLQALAGQANISFEGDLTNLRLGELAGASDQESAALKRNTLWPKLDFCVVPLEPGTINNLLSALGGNIPKKVIHIQIERRGSLEFAAYDGFRPGCIVFGNAIGQDLIESLVSQRIISRFAAPVRGSR